MPRSKGSAAFTECEMPTEHSILRIVLVPEDRRREPTIWKSQPISSDRKPRPARRLRLQRR